MELDDRVKALLAEDQIHAAVTLALRELEGAVFGYLASLHDVDDAQDVYSLYELDVLRGLPGFRFECSLRSWAFRLAWHASARFRRDLWRQRGERLPSSAASRLAASLASSQLPGGPKDTLRRLRESLDPEDRTLFVLHVDQELEWEEVAVVLSAEGPPVKAATLRKRYERIKARLARLAREQGLLE